MERKVRFRIFINININLLSTGGKNTFNNINAVLGYEQMFAGNVNKLTGVRRIKILLGNLR